MNISFYIWSFKIGSYVQINKLSLIKWDQYWSKTSYPDVDIFKFRFFLEYFFKKWKQTLNSNLDLDLIFFANYRLISRFFMSCFHCYFENSTFTFKVLLSLYYIIIFLLILEKILWKHFERFLSPYLLILIGEKPLIRMLKSGVSSSQ